GISPYPAFNAGLNSNGLLIFIRLVFFATGLVVVLAADEPARETALGPDAPIKDVPIVVAAYVNQRERLSAFPFVTSRSYDVLIPSFLILYASLILFSLFLT